MSTDLEFSEGVRKAQTETIDPLIQVVFLSLQYFLYGVFLNPLYVCKVNREDPECLSVKHNPLAAHSPGSLYFRPGRVHIP